MLAARTTCPHCNETFFVENCGNCENFHRHYTRWSHNGTYNPLDDGHCDTPRIKPRKTSNLACEHWTRKEEPE